MWYKLKLMSQSEHLAVGLKWCPCCRQYLPLEVFFINRHNKTNGRSGHCKACVKIKARVYRKRPPGQAALAARKWKAENPQKWKTACRSNMLKSKYNLSTAEYDKMLQNQDGVCIICRNPETRKIRGELSSLSVDHCHKTGKIRGLLCMCCNSGLGYFKDSEKLLRVAIEYLSK